MTFARPRSEREVTQAKWDNPLASADAAVAVEHPRLRLTVERERGAAALRESTFEGDTCRIGSHPSNDLVVDDPTISRFHCRIERQAGTWRIVDAGSRNGTRASGVKIVTAELEHEAQLEIGDSIVRVRADGVAVRPAAQAARAFGSIVGTSAPMLRLFAALERIAPAEIDVLIQGESGTGKELVAAEIVGRSPRANGPLVVVDCGSISPSLVESELFGHVRGAFTGADRDREGAFEAGDGGTVFLDEIGELPLELQPKLLRVLEQREVRRVGTSRARRVDVRVLAATHRDIEREVNRGRFREDLYYRLAKVRVSVPPLRDRLEDIPLLVLGFLDAFGDARAERLFSRAVVEQMQKHDWPGNVRELRNYIERSIVLRDCAPPSSSREAAMRTMQSGTVPVSRVQSPEGEAASAADRTMPFRRAKELAIEAFERAYIGPLLEECEGNMSKAARTAQMDRMYLHQLAQKYGLKASRKP